MYHALYALRAFYIPMPKVNDTGSFNEEMLLSKTTDKAQLSLTVKGSMKEIG